MTAVDCRDRPTSRRPRVHRSGPERLSPCKRNSALSRREPQPLVRADARPAFGSVPCITRFAPELQSLLSLMSWQRARTTPITTGKRRPATCWVQIPAVIADLSQDTDTPEGTESTARAAIGDGDGHIGPAAAGHQISLGSLGCTCSRQSFPVSVVEPSLYDPDGYLESGEIRSSIGCNL